MSLSRRHFVQLASLSLLAGAALPSALAQKGDDVTFSPENMAGLEGLTRQSFEPYLREKFSVSLAGKSLGRLTLIEVKDLTSATTALAARGALSQRRSLSSFALRFQGSGGQLPQDTYTLSQAALGSFPLLLVPAAPGANPRTYTAIFTSFAK